MYAIPVLSAQLYRQAFNYPVIPSILPGGWRAYSFASTEVTSAPPLCNALLLVHSSVSLNVSDFIDRPWELLVMDIEISEHSLIVCDESQWQQHILRKDEEYVRSTVLFSAFVVW